MKCLANTCLLSVLASMLVGCEYMYACRGAVYSAVTTKPLAGVEVRWRGHSNSEVHTDSTGEFGFSHFGTSIPFMDWPQQGLEVWAPGYKPVVIHNLEAYPYAEHTGGSFGNVRVYLRPDSTNPEARLPIDSSKWAAQSINYGSAAVGSSQVVPVPGEGELGCRGRVYDALSKQPLADVRVNWLAPATDESLTTDSTGAFGFALADRPNSDSCPNQELLFLAASYQPLRITNVYKYRQRDSVAQCRAYGLRVYLQRDTRLYPSMPAL